MSAVRASGDPSTLVTAMVAEPQALAQSSASTISWVDPDWLTPMVTVSARSRCASYRVATDGAANDDGTPACTSAR